MKRVTSIVLAIVLFAGILLTAAPTAYAASSMTVSDSLVEVLKQEEGFAAKPYWDYGQYTVGYGTACPSDMVEYYSQNGISEEAAEVLLRNHLASTENVINKRFIDQYGLSLTQGQFDALVSFTYNCGSAWIYETSGTFHNAVKNGATGSELIRAFSLWCSAGGQILPGLVRRRLSEASMFLEGHYSRYAPSNYCYVYYNANGGSVSYRIQGYDANLGTAPAYTPTKGGETFLGWYTSQVGGSVVTALTADLSGATLYARWDDGKEEEKLPADEGVDVVVTGNYVNLRKGPGTNYGIVGMVNSGHRMHITEVAEGSGYRWGNDNGTWICLNYTNYDSALAEKEAAKQETTEPTEETTEETTAPAEETTEETTVPETEETTEATTEPTTQPTEPEPVAVTGTVRANGGLALREGPGTGYRCIRYLNNGSRVTILEQTPVGSMTWGKTSEGWISMTYVIVDQPAPTEPAPEPTTEETVAPTTEATTEATVAPTTEETTEATMAPETEATTEATTAPETEATTEATTAPETEPTTEETTAPETEPSTEAPTEAPTEVPTEAPTEAPTEPPVPETTAPAPVTITGTVKADGGLAVRNGAGTHNSVRRYLYNGASVTVAETASVNGLTWGKISDGWICMNYVVQDGGASTKMVVADCLRVRSAPGTENWVVGYVYYGAYVTVYETAYGWGRIDSGWVSMDYLR